MKYRSGTKEKEKEQASERAKAKERENGKGNGGRNNVVYEIFNFAIYIVNYAFSVHKLCLCSHTNET